MGSTSEHSYILIYKIFNGHWSGAFLNLDDLIRRQAVGFMVDGLGGLFAGGVYQAKNCAFLLVVPIAEILYLVLALVFQVKLVGFKDSLGSQSFNIFVDI
jgi:hypothetical protein